MTMPSKQNLVVDKFFEIQNQLKLLHWQTKSYARHMAFGTAGDALAGLVDDFVEVHMAKYGRVMSSGSVRLQNGSRGIAESFIADTESFLVGLTSVYDASMDSDLLNIRDEMLGILNKMKYQLTLK